MSLAQEMVEESKAELESLLGELAHGSQSEEIKAKAAELAELAIEVMVAKVGGADTQIAEAALAASAQNLAAAASVNTARAVLAFAEHVFRRAATVVISAAVGAL